MFFKESEIGKQLIDVIGNTEGIQVAVLTNSFIKKGYDSNTDVDLLFIGTMKVRELSGSISKLEKDLKRDIRLVLLQKKISISQEKRKEPFLMNILENDKIILYGQISDIL